MSPNPKKDYFQVELAWDQSRFRRDDWGAGCCSNGEDLLGFVNPLIDGQIYE